jgi:hypothetical protein
MPETFIPDMEILPDRTVQKKISRNLFKNATNLDYEVRELIDGHIISDDEPEFITFLKANSKLLFTPVFEHLG